jgi:hypothetical protein
MTAYWMHQRTMFECVDEDQESLISRVGQVNGASFYHVQTQCDPGDLSCPPYDQYEELNCVVCTK